MAQAIANEISLLRQLRGQNHPNIVRVLDFICSNNGGPSRDKEMLNYDGWECKNLLNKEIRAEIDQTKELGIVMEYLPQSLEDFMN